ncbi:MAG TPA: hypothetical protein VMQ76_07910, partial [Terracidiphilus sp.]|nr:hypothetical protein [Terracidiphilus sp.]
GEDIPLRSQRAQQMFLEMDGGKGWVSGLERHLQSYLLTGNGGHIEIVRATGAAGSRILGLVPLDPLRCLRTGDPDVPLLYRDRMGNLHELKDYQTFHVTDMPDPQELWFGCGHCAAERAYFKIITMQGLENYLEEKITGRRPTSLYIINGLSTPQIETAMRTAQEDAQSKGMVNYMGAAVAAVIDPTAPPGMIEIPFTKVPDGFNPVEERREAKLLYADALGIDPQELDPALTARGAMGTGAQSVVLAEKEKGKGMWAWDKKWSYCVNYHTLDDRTTFYFEENDLRDQAQKADIFLKHATGENLLVTNGTMTGQQGMNWFVDQDEMPKEFAPTDMTPDEDLTDTEKPETAAESAQAAEGTPAATPTAAAPAMPPAKATPQQKANKQGIGLREYWNKKRHPQETKINAKLDAQQAAKKEAQRVADLIREELDAAAQMVEVEDD